MADSASYDQCLCCGKVLGWSGQSDRLVCDTRCGARFSDGYQESDDTKARNFQDSHQRFQARIDRYRQTVVNQQLAKDRPPCG